MSQTHNDTPDLDPIETQEWLDSLASVLQNEGAERAHFILENLVKYTRRRGVHLPFDATTAYLNTIPVGKEQKSPGNHELEHRIRSAIRWNAAAMVIRAGKKDLELGGHISSFASSATLYDVGFNHFWKAKGENGEEGDLVFIQGHSAPGIYARAFIEGRLSEDQLNNFRQEIGGNGLSSYPHPHLMPNFWQFPTVSMGLGPLMAIYQARFLKYLDSRGLSKTAGRKVWCFLGDGEMSEPESLGAISLAAREGLDNLIFVINCNLQRLDGPVHGNGKIIQEFEGTFRGAGWNVIKVIWGGKWDALLAKDTNNILKQRMEEVLDGDYQTFKSKDGAYVREHFFNTPELKAMVANMSDDEIWSLNRGGHDPHKVYAAYHEAVNNADGRPTVILAKTIKGYGMGASGEGQNVAHQSKKMDVASLKQFRTRFNIQVTDEQIDSGDLPYFRFPEDSEEMRYLRERRNALGGYLPARNPATDALPIPELSAFDAQLQTSGDREFSTTMAFVRILNTLLKDKQLGKRIVPIVPDESRTFGMEGMFRQYGIWNLKGQQYTPQDKDQLMFYKESIDGQILQEGINEPGAMADWIAAATSYANNRYAMIPFYIYYSMFGFQRVGDLAWAAGDMHARGFLLGGTAGRTTLNGEGLQHEDGHSHIQADLIPNCLSYDPTYQYEIAVIVQDGLRRMYVEQEDVWYYITLMNENYKHPAMPQRENIERDILKGMYLLREGAKSDKKVQLMGSGVILEEVIHAADLLKADFGVDADVWSCTSFNLLHRDAMEVERHNRLHPTGEQKVSFVAQQLKGHQGPVVAATDYIRSFANRIREAIPAENGEYVVLGTDGFGRSDSRANLRSFFEVDRYHVAVAALNALANQGKIDRNLVQVAIEKYGIKVDNTPSWKC
ncbi:pyruvate dehydrogenase (acetyl-transferring), homodimeric type [Kingella kingae]|uniref:pyruvate dehydrogenase (acetyl-transferring), homodimeric type n=1 Tax=Kingella kingae TaxID=504 RepID=UPI000425FA16|nr:pyruvate dehydrogenase (acetyl-transferring), homodimeric type [Kingella kingae]MDK4525984.1 pyruvate dehydrogenase (acetyl-transferring), homodimeric type [Kingella kingae]MDK4529423.1 pyruvate dehydrogenase (acetyl-transferring), homodimeric type [Kingella kingae]MDK4531988.1 pyruvate dehydrogenase (acetyl-transferring), homodimeric type [Kingella kingae]MDK4579815.1 pyruvate dehydrogenase (acetyl-transferring), homodimeric type [Kingella kingae]MDK4623819.1 pyruvate dehydrogenase (acetyl